MDHTTENEHEEDTDRQQLVFNLSKTQLNHREQQILNKGLSYVPPTPTDPFKLKVEMFRFYRSLKLKYFFKRQSPLMDIPHSADPEQAAEPLRHTSQAQPLKPKSQFCPPVSNAAITTFCNLVDRDIDNILLNADGKSHGNQERQLLTQLGKRPDVVWKAADKGGGIVLLNKDEYRAEIASQLSNDRCYIKLPKNPTPDFKKEIDNFLNESLDKGHISQTERRFLTTNHPVTPVIYILPKVHKTLVNPPGRPIVACNDSLMEPLSLYVDRILRPLVVKLPSYLRDTNDFIEQLSNAHINCDTEDMFLTTMDVVSLYTNIPHDKGMIAIEHFLSLRTDPQPPTNFLMDMVHLLLHKNFFLFENHFYLQTQGAAMGSRFSPDYACLFMGYLEERYIWNNNPFFENVVLWKRFVDDVFCLFKGPLETFNDFVTYLNNMVHSIKFNVVIDKRSVSFLDTVVHLEGRNIWTTLYTKPTDKNSILHATSAHPPALKRGLPYTQFLRAKRICTNTSDFNLEITRMYKQFSLRGYHNTCLNEALDKVHRTSTPPKRDKRSSIVCTTTYSKHSAQIKDAVKRHWHVLSSDDTCRALFPDLPLFAHHRAKNIRDFLVKADNFNVRSGVERLSRATGFHPCRSCAACHNNSVKKNTVIGSVTNKTYKLKQFTTCSTRNVVYLITCPCKKQYVGKTNRPVKTRIIEHNSSIRRKDEKSPVARHFNEAGHPVSSLAYTVLEHVTPARRGGDLERRLLQRECFWIFSLKTVHPLGMNEELVLSCFL